MAFTGYTDTTVKYFRSWDSGAPAGSVQVADEINLILQGCLVNGYGQVTLDSVVVSSGVATATLSTGHNFTGVGPGYEVGPVLLIAGVTDKTDLNGEVRPLITSTTTFTFDATGVSDGAASGTITAKIAPAGWTNPYSGTNIEVFRQGGENQRYFRVDDSQSAAVSYAFIRGYAAMTDATDSGTDPFPTVAQYTNGLYLHKSNSNTTPRPWVVVATDTDIYLGIETAGNGVYYGGFFYGDMYDVDAGDSYNTCVASGSSSSSSSFAIASQGSLSGRCVCRNRAGDAGATAFVEYGPNAGGLFKILGTGGSTTVRIYPVEAWDSTSNPRGLSLKIRLSGEMDAYPSDSSPNMNNVFDTGGDLAKMVVAVRVASTSPCFFRIV